MTTVKWTPGPWHYRTYDGSIGSVDDANGDAVAQSQQRPNKDNLMGNPERIANGFIIAAAPELYEALVALTGAIHPQADNSPYIMGLLEAADAALAKARGEQ